MYEATGNIEALFSSKMLATINADMPIWNPYVVQNFCLNMKGKTKEDQLKCAVDLYDQMISWYAAFLKTENGRDCITEFDRIMPSYAWMSDVKKIDFFFGVLGNKLLFYLSYHCSCFTNNPPSSSGSITK